MKIPFNYLPASWGLKGKSRKIAEAEYYLSGIDLELKLIDINEENEIEKQLKTLVVKRKYEKITEYDFDIETTKLKFTGDDLVLALLDIEYKHHKIEKQAYEKQSATIRKEPWVSMPDISWNPQDPSQSYFELDYNDEFVSFLKNHGYNGLTDEMVVEKWLNDVCRSVAEDFISDENPSSFVSLAATTTKKIKRNKTKKSEYS
jgi:hypothetical protein